MSEHSLRAFSVFMNCECGKRYFRFSPNDKHLQNKCPQCGTYKAEIKDIPAGKAIYIFKVEGE